VSVKEVNEKYRCNICGNEAIVTKVGGGTLVCCGEEMELIEPKKTKRSILEEGFEVEDKEENDEKEPKEKEDYEEDEEEEENEEEEI
jgi:desulfoferrodoxin-like iron-binding protein